MNYPFPTKLAFSQTEIPKRFGVVTVEQDPDPAIHFKVVVPLNWGQVSGVRRLVTPKNPFELRTHLRSLSDSETEAKISIAYVTEEMSPSDWLALYLEQQGEKVLHERHMPQEGGTVPDVLTLGGKAGNERVSRWTVLKDHARIGGAHFFMLQTSTAASKYNTDMANVFFVAISNFDLLKPNGWAYAEQLRTLVRAVPVKFSTAYPLSWHQVENPASNDHFYQVKFLKSVGDQAIGRISLAMAVGQAKKDMLRLEEEDRLALAKEENATFEQPHFVAGPTYGSLRETLTATMSQVNVGSDQLARERSVLIGNIDGTSWLYADFVSPTRQSAPGSWAVSRRAFTILLEHLRIG